jgi:hypothetical protein
MLDDYQINRIKFENYLKNRNFTIFGHIKHMKKITLNGHKYDYKYCCVVWYVLVWDMFWFKNLKYKSVNKLYEYYRNFMERSAKFQYIPCPVCLAKGDTRKRTEVNNGFNF